MIPPPMQGSSGSAREGSTPGVTAKISGLLSAGASEKHVETPKEDLAKRGPQP